MFEWFTGPSLALIQAVRTSNIFVRVPWCTCLVDGIILDNIWIPNMFQRWRRRGKIRKSTSLRICSIDLIKRFRMVRSRQWIDTVSSLDWLAAHDSWLPDMFKDDRHWRVSPNIRGITACSIDELAVIYFQKRVRAEMASVRLPSKSFSLSLDYEERHMILTGKGQLQGPKPKSAARAPGHFVFMYIEYMPGSPTGAVTSQVTPRSGVGHVTASIYVPRLRSTGRYLIRKILRCHHCLLRRPQS